MPMLRRFTYVRRRSANPNGWPSNRVKKGGLDEFFAVSQLFDPPVKEPPSPSEKPPVKEPGKPHEPPPSPQKPPVEEPPNAPREPPVEEPPPKDPNRTPPNPPKRRVGAGKTLSSAGTTCLMEMAIG